MKSLSPTPPPIPEDLPMPPVAALRPRIWPAITVPVLALLASIVAVGISIFIGISIAASSGATGEVSAATFEDVNGLLLVLAKSPYGIWLVALPGQIIFFFAALIPALISPERTRQRLALARGRLPLWTWPLIAIGTPVLGILVSIILHLLDVEMSESLEFLTALISGRSGAALVAAFILIGLAPGICEELLFRGYLQSRLLKRWRPATAIGFSAVIFAIAHLDPVHSISVLPLGLWLGYVAYRTGSVFPAMLGHAANNAAAVVLMQSGDTITKLDLLILLPSAVAFISSMILFVRHKRPVDEELAAKVVAK